MKYEHLSNCVGKTLTKIVEPGYIDSLILVFADAWTLVSIQSDDDDAYIELPHDRDKTRLVHCGYDKAELSEAGILDSQDLAKINADRQWQIEQKIRETEHILANLKQQAMLEGIVP